MAQHLTRYDSSNTLAWSAALSERQIRRFRRLPGWLAPLLRSARGQQPSPPVTVRPLRQCHGGEGRAL